jgi:hypothetical protein
MWILGLLGFYVIYRLIFRWYLVSLLKMGYDPLLAPKSLHRPLFNFGIYGLAFCIFCFSTYTFYKVDPWMVLLSPALLFVAMFAHGAKQSKRRDEVIALAVRTQIPLEKLGASRAQINDAISVATLGEGFDLGSDWELNTLPKSYILPTLGLFTAISALTRGDEYDLRSLERYHKDSAEIDALVDREYNRQSSARRASK